MIKMLSNRDGRVQWTPIFLKIQLLNHIMHNRPKHVCILYFSLELIKDIRCLASVTNSTFKIAESTKVLVTSGFAGFCRFLQVSAGFCGFLQVSAGFCRFLQVSVVFCRFLRVFWMSTGFCRFLQISTSFLGFYRFLQVSAGFGRFLQVCLFQKSSIQVKKALVGNTIYEFF